MSEFVIPLALPHVTDADIAAVTRVLRSGVLTQGPEIDALEDKLAAACNTRHAVAVSSGTAALHLLMLIDGIGLGDVLLTTPFTFAATAMCALYTGASVHLVDIRPDTWNMSVASLKEEIRAVTGNKRAVMAVDVFGVPADIVSLRGVMPYGEHIYEDAAEALGSLDGHAPCGSLARAGVVAFYPNKQIVAGEGGAIVTNNSFIAESARMLRNNGRVPGKHIIEDLGYNYRMDEMSAALASSQLDRLAEIRTARQAAAQNYRDMLEDTPEITLQYIPQGATVNPFVFVVSLHKQRSTTRRDAIITRMAELGFQCRAYFECLQRHPLFKRMKVTGDTPAADAISNGALALPFAQGITPEQQRAVVDGLKTCLVKRT